ncbi:MAG: AMP-binding protein [Clostridia bacterium]|nr:AMP-binding protein [Clostridia bacterium]
MSIINNVKKADQPAKQQEIKVHTRPKTARLYERVNDSTDFCRHIRKHGDKVAYTYFDKNKQLCDLTYEQLYRKILKTAAGLTDAGYAGKKIAIIGETSVEWISAYLAILCIGGVAIPMDKELEIPVIEGFLETAEADGIIYSRTFNGKFESAMKSHPTLKLFAAMDPDEEELARGAVSTHMIRKAGSALVKQGYVLPKVENRDKMAEMLFTSGTTGTSKCVMLSQKNIFSVVCSACETVDFNPDDVIVSVLPIHHTYELAVMLAALVYGIHVCINDSLTHVLRNFQLFKPTGLVLVPLFVYTMYKKVWSEAKRTGQDKKLKLGLGASKAMMSVGLDKRRQIFGAVLEAFGGRLEKIICGGAALNPRMIEFFESIGISIYEGFGITECAPLTFVTPYYARKYGSVGPAVPCCQGRIGEGVLNDKGYIEGEIQIKGDNVMLGYYKNPEATAEVFTDDGWFRTGDMGYMDKDGYFYITGRLKSVIVLENGKNVFPEEIEEYLGNIELIAESVVVGRQNGSNVTLTAIVFPDHKKFDDEATDEEIREAIEKEINAMNKKLPTYKQIKGIEYRNVEFEKTTSKKIKRHLVK